MAELTHQTSGVWIWNAKQRIYNNVEYNAPIQYYTNDRITEFVKNSDNPNNYNGEREFRLLDKDFIATGDGFSLPLLSKYYPECELLN